MDQLELDLYPYRSKTISEVENQGMDLEDWLHIKRQNLGKLDLDHFYSLLKNSKKARLSFLKKFLTRNKIVYETGSWESIDYN